MGRNTGAIGREHDAASLLDLKCLGGELFGNLDRKKGFYARGVRTLDRREQGGRKALTETQHSRGSLNSSENMYSISLSRKYIQL